MSRAADAPPALRALLLRIASDDPTEAGALAIAVSIKHWTGPDTDTFLAIRGANRTFRRSVWHRIRAIERDSRAEGDSPGTGGGQ